MASESTWPAPGSMKWLNVVGAAGRLVGPGDGLDAGADFVDGAAAVALAEVQVQRPRGDQAGDVRRVAVLEPAGDEVREAVQDVRAVDGRVGRQAAVAHQALSRGSHGPTSQVCVEPIEWP